MITHKINFNKKVVIPALIAVIIGGLVFTAIQIKKPGPLFSSAYPGACQSWLDLANDTMRQANARPILQSRMEELNEQSTEYFAQLGECSAVICDEIVSRVDTLQTQIREADRLLDQLVEERDDFLATHPQPWSPEEQSQFESLVLQGFRAEEELMRLNEELEDAENTVNELGCTFTEEEFVVFDDHCLEQIINGETWCIFDPAHEYNEYGGGSGRPLSTGATTTEVTPPTKPSLKDKFIKDVDKQTRPY